MDTKTEDVCVVRGFRLTEYQFYDEMKVLKTYFNIRDIKGYVYGPDYDNLAKPLNIMLSLETGNIKYTLSGDVSQITNRCINAY